MLGVNVEVEEFDPDEEPDPDEFPVLFCVLCFCCVQCMKVTFELKNHDTKLKKTQI